MWGLLGLQSRGWTCIWEEGLILDLVSWLSSTYPLALLTCHLVLVQGLGLWPGALPCPWRVQLPGREPWA